MEKDTTESAWLHSIREELRSAKPSRPPVTVNVEDAIFTRLVEAEELLIVALGLFTELAGDKDNWLFKHKDDIVGARSALHRAIHDISFAK